MKTQNLINSIITLNLPKPIIVLKIAALVGIKMKHLGYLKQPRNYKMR